MRPASLATQSPLFAYNCRPHIKAISLPATKYEFGNLKKDSILCSGLEFSLFIFTSTINLKNRKMKKYLAEFIGTFWLVLGGCGSAVLAAGFPNVGIGLLGVSFAFGLTVLTI